ncbi:hypothetical protein BN946_scf184346.g2 [Trametes cinnabarina]|uniref:Uncharacterized protein n=1 Tax=Pycnoporus cinnabarinus TaxID=5643 RepID=A0A060SNY1_PYCCI|nr:hypothetical protein BN946_scf184346.g2 [Trametes cinnabarina]
MDEQTMSGNNLWSLLVNFLTVTPERDGKHKHKHHHQHQHKHEEHHDDARSRQAHAEEAGDGGTHDLADDAHKSKRERFVSRFAKLVADRRKSSGAQHAAKSTVKQ